MLNDLFTKASSFSLSTTWRAFMARQSERWQCSVGPWTTSAWSSAVHIAAKQWGRWEHLHCFPILVVQYWFSSSHQEWDWAFPILWEWTPWCNWWHLVVDTGGLKDQTGFKDAQHGLLPEPWGSYSHFCSQHSHSQWSYSHSCWQLKLRRTNCWWDKPSWDK